MEQYGDSAAVTTGDEAQLEFAFVQPLAVVANCWGPVYHLQRGDRTAWYDEHPGSFWTIEEAVAFARQHGEEPIVDEECRAAWSSWSPEEIEAYQRDCGRMT